MNDLRANLRAITTEFLELILNAMKNAPLDELIDGPVRTGPRGGVGTTGPNGLTHRQPAGAASDAPNGRRKRASSEEMQALKSQVLGAVKQLGPEFSKADVSKKVQSKINLSRILALLVADGNLRKKGDRRLARYWVK